MDHPRSSREQGKAVTAVSISQGCCNKAQQTGQLKTPKSRCLKTCLFTVLKKTKQNETNTKISVCRVGSFWGIIYARTLSYLLMTAGTLGLP